MLEYIYLAVAVILVVGIAIVGVVMYRRDGSAGLEGMTYAEPGDVAESEASGMLEGTPVANESPAGLGAAVQPVTSATLPAASGMAAAPGMAAAAGVAAGIAASAATTAAPAPALAPSAAVAYAASAAGQGAAPAPVPAPPPSPAPVAVFAPAAASPAPATVSYVPVSGPGSYASHAAAGNGSAGSAPLTDPLGAVILSLVDGKGQLSGLELKRLDVFRPEMIEVAAEAVDLPPKLANDQQVLLRLAQVKLYAATLDLRAKWAAQMLRIPDGQSDKPLSAREFKLKMARDIMALPAPDRSEVIGFLLGGVLSSNGSSPDLKRAVIDTLEHLHSAALVNVLLDCLDDPDPIIQEYALAAADRLLDGK
jgi:hypothetical protein